MKHILLCIACAVAALGASAGPEVSLAVLPGSAELTTPESRQQFLAEGTVDGYQQDWTKKAQWTSSNPQVASVNATGFVEPKSDGQATITAKMNGMTAVATVKVRGSHAPFNWSFRNNVIPVMSKVGCNQGACHGALAGKHGFKLTLRGYDPVVDYDTLTREGQARRVSLTDPAASLILLKPTFTIPHGGGKRFTKDSLEFRILSEWIAEGAPPPSPKDPQVTGLEVFPKAAELKAGETQQLVVRAKYSDGHVEDVSHWVKYSSNNEGTASVDDNGLVKMNGSGQAAITLWYSSRVLYSRLTVPYLNQVPVEAYKNSPRHNYIDDYVVAQLKTLHIQPSPLCSDAVFLRRAYLDAAGILPTSEEVENFLADKSPDKRQKLIDQLLQREEFNDYWAYKWSDLLLINSKRLRPDEMWSFYNWVRDSVKENKPWNKFAYEIFTSSGDTRKNGALNYYVLHKNPIDLAETSAEAFLGQRVTCARCHNHPLEKWTQTQYYEFANLFARVGVKNGNAPGDVVVFAKTSGDVNHPRLARPLPPAPLDGKSIPLDSPIDRRLVFAKWLVSDSNTGFARNLVNRVWANFYGRGLVNPMDDLRSTNPASNEDLLDAVSKDFVAHGYDVKYLIRTIMNSGTYQLSSESNATNQKDDIFYSKYIVRRLPAEVILDALSQVTGVPTVFPGYPVGTRAIQLPDSKVPSPFLTTFGRPLRDICDASERTDAPTVGQALDIINGDTLNKKLSAPNGYIALLQKIGLSNSRIIEHLYLSAYSRYPTPQEKQQLTAMLDKASNIKGTLEAQRDARQQALQDMVWAMLTSKEFIFNY